MPEIITALSDVLAPMTRVVTSNDTDDRSSQSCLRESNAIDREIRELRELLSERKRFLENQKLWEEKVRSNLSSLEADLIQFGKDRINKIKEKCAGKI
jgi:hypothetical protein